MKKNLINGGIMTSKEIVDELATALEEYRTKRRIRNRHKGRLAKASRKRNRR